MIVAVPSSKGLVTPVHVTFDPLQPVKYRIIVYDVAFGESFHVRETPSHVAVVDSPVTAAGAAEVVVTCAHAPLGPAPHMLDATTR